MALEHFENTLSRNAANHVPLSPLSFIRRARNVFPHQPAVIYGERRYSWRELYDGAVRLASALTARGIGKGDTVSIMAANTPEILEAHFGVPMAGAVLNTINTRLDADTVAYILEHGDARMLIADTQFSPGVEHALAIRGKDELLVVDLVDDQAELAPGEGARLDELSYEELLQSGDPELEWRLHDGAQLGEILIRGGTVMKAYYKDSAATEKAFSGGYFHSEDLAMVHPDGYIEFRDRLKDVIISGGENISSVEVESVLYKNPAVVLAAVVARPDEGELIVFFRQHLAGFKSPKAVTFGGLPKTATAKIKKFVLRQSARAG